MSKKTHPFVSGTKLDWKVHTSRLLEEILTNNNMGALVIPINIFKNVLVELTAEAIRIDDDRLNAIMMRLTLYDQGDPYSKDYQPDAAEMIKKARTEELDLPDHRILDQLHLDEPDWTILDRVGPAMRKEWASMPLRIRIACVLDSVK